MAAAAEGLIASFTLLGFTCADGCEKYANATATEVGPCSYDRQLKEYNVTVTSYGYELTNRDTEKIKQEILEQIEGSIEEQQETKCG